jgi:hypothetical protein
LKENYELICELNIDDVYKKIRLWKSLYVYLDNQGI